MIMIEGPNNNSEKEPKSLIERLEEILGKENIDTLEVFSLMTEHMKNREGGRENGVEFLSLISEKDPFPEAKVSVEYSDNNGWKNVRVDSWEKAFLLGLEPGKTEDIPEFILDENGNLTDVKNSFFEQVRKLDK